MNEIDLYLQYKCEKGLKALKLAKQPQYVERLKYELSVIIQMGFSGYFLIVQDFVLWSKRNKIPVGAGRGSGAGSLACYCLGITNIDPLEQSLIFERFLNPARMGKPTINTSKISFENFKKDIMPTLNIELE